MNHKRTIFLHTGSNLGTRRAFLTQAREMIAQKIGTITKASHYYETEAWGMTDQPDFINQALAVETEMVPDEILYHVKKIEKDIGRIKNAKWHERIIDIDILFYGDKVVSTKKLKIPHPFCHERMFVLIPLMEIAGDYVHPKLRATIEELYVECEDPLQVIMLEDDIAFNDEEE